MMAIIGAGRFPGAVHTYTTSGTESSPAGATQVVIEIWGAGGGGSKDATNQIGSGGASGAYVKKTLALSGVTSWAYVVGTGGAGHVGGSDGNGSPGGASTITSLSLNAGGGGGGLQSGSAAIGGTASGGDVNTNGNSSTLNSYVGATAPNGGAAATSLRAPGNAPGGGGAASWLTGAAGDGAVGQAKFTYT